jgi:hypothetical protein
LLLGEMYHGAKQKNLFEAKSYSSFHVCVVQRLMRRM